MTKRLTSVLISLLANAVSLALAAWILPGFDVTTGWYLAAVVLFTALSVGLRIAVAGTRFVRAYTIAGGLALSFAALGITDLIVPAPGFSINGWGAWLAATAIVWAAGVAYGEVDSHAPQGTPGQPVGGPAA